LAFWRTQVLDEMFHGRQTADIEMRSTFTFWCTQVLDEVFKGAHVEHQPKVSPSAATPTEVGCIV
jgi:hypothetical protein